MELGARDLIDEFEARQLEAAVGAEAAADPSPTAAAAEAPKGQLAPPAPAVDRRRSPRGNLSTASIDAAEQHRVHMAMSAIGGMQDLEEVQLQFGADAAVANAVTAGLSVLEDGTPATYREAMDSPDKDKWRAAMEKEVAAMEAMQAWDLVPRSSVPKGHRVLPVKWVLKKKTNELGEVTSFKARITPKGFLQREGVDYFETFARTGMYKSMKVGISLAAKWDHELHQMDMSNAFLNSEIEEEVYQESPRGSGKEGNTWCAGCARPSTG